MRLLSITKEVYQGNPFSLTYGLDSVFIYVYDFTNPFNFNFFVFFLFLRSLIVFLLELKYFSNQKDRNEVENQFIKIQKNSRKNP